MDRRSLLFRAGMTRVFAGILVLVAMPLVNPKLAASRDVAVCYLAFAIVEQLLILRNLGDPVRSYVAGIGDVVALTILVHRAGTVGTVYPALYVLAALLNALVVGFGAGIVIAAVGSLAYAAVVLLELRGVLPYAPQGNVAPPTTADALGAIGLIDLLMLGSATIVGLLVGAVRKREAELTAANAHLDALSQRDPLTNLANRRHLLDRLEIELERVRRGHSAAVLMLDLDGFKRINDTQGHLRGDLLLKEVAEALAATTRVSDVAARYGGDEFVLLLPDADLARAEAVAARVVETVREVGLRFDVQRPVTASVGIAVATREDAVASLLRRADENAYAAKRSGGNRTVEQTSGTQARAVTASLVWTPLAPDVSRSAFRRTTRRRPVFPGRNASTRVDAVVHARGRRRKKRQHGGRRGNATRCRAPRARDGSRRCSARPDDDGPVLRGASRRQARPATRAGLTRDRNAPGQRPSVGGRCVDHAGAVACPGGFACPPPAPPP